MCTTLEQPQARNLLQRLLKEKEALDWQMRNAEYRRALSDDARKAAYSVLDNPQRTGNLVFNPFLPRKTEPCPENLEAPHGDIR